MREGTDGRVVIAGVSVTSIGMHCHDPNMVMSSNPSRVELGVIGTSVLSLVVLESE